MLDRGEDGFHNALILIYRLILPRSSLGMPSKGYQLVSSSPEEDDHSCPVVRNANGRWGNDLLFPEDTKLTSDLVLQSLTGRQLRFTARGSRYSHHHHHPHHH